MQTKLQLIVVSFSALLAFNSAALPLVLNSEERRGEIEKDYGVEPSILTYVERAIEKIRFNRGEIGRSDTKQARDAGTKNDVINGFERS